MTTYTNNATIVHTTNANFQAWVNEVYTALVTQLGLTQTADTGQMAVPCVSAIPAINIYAGYYVFSFNDALQATAPIFFRIDFGSGPNPGIPAMALSVGTGSNGAGTMTGLGSVPINKLGLSYNAVPGGAPYNSYYCYNATQGVAWFNFKYGAMGTNSANAVFAIARTVNAAGAPTANGAMVLTIASSTGTGVYGATTILNYSENSVYYGPQQWFGGPPLAAVPFGESTSLKGTTANVFPVWQYSGNATTPGAGITNAFGIGVAAETGNLTTLPINILGTLTMTYIALQYAFGPYGYNFALSGTYTTFAIWQ